MNESDPRIEALHRLSATQNDWFGSGVTTTTTMKGFDMDIADVMADEDLTWSLFC